MVRSAQWVRRLRAGAALAMCGSAMQFSGCMDSDIMKRFRQGYAPGLIQGLTTALATPGNAEAGLRRTATAFAEGIGAVVQPRTQVAASGSSGSSSSSASSGSSSSSSSSSGSSGSSSSSGSSGSSSSSSSGS